MKVYSLYYKENYVASFPKREDVINYAKSVYPSYDDAYECNIIEEYLYKTQQLPHTPLTTPSQPIPYTRPPVISKPPTRYPDTYPEIYGDGSSLKSSCSDGPQGDIGISDYGLTK
jgi:hypothetical protein